MPTMDTTAACITGDWTIQNVAQHRQTLLQQLEDGHYEFDAAGVADMDSAGLQLLLAARNALAKQGKELKLGPCSASVKAVLTSYGLDMTLQAHPSKGGAL